MSASKHIFVKGARVHNLKNIDVTLPRDQLVVLTGLSGSGKSSLAFDTIYAEGQRRYVESLSSYARQFLQMQDKPDVDLIEGLSPAISIEQKTTSKNPRSTVATVTEIYDYLRLLFARVGKPFCYNCGRPIEGRTASQIIDEVMTLAKGSKISVLAPVVRERKGEYRKELQDFRKQGFARVRIDGELRFLEEDIVLNPKQKHSIDLVIDRLVVNGEQRGRIADAIELALKKASGLVTLIEHTEGKENETLFSEHFACTDCGISYPEIEPRMFSFNAPQGACPTCSGLGNFLYFDEELVIPNDELSLDQGVIAPYAKNLAGYYHQMIDCVARAFKIPTSTPWNKLKKEHREAILKGTSQPVRFLVSGYDSRSHRFEKPYEGVLPQLERRYKETESEGMREDLEQYMSQAPCQTCKGERLRKESLHVKVGNISISQLTAFSITKATEFFTQLSLDKKESLIAKPILKEVQSRLEFLLAVGLEYLTLDRAAGTLSGGEAQRIRLATQIGSALVGVLYVLDEPSIGLHQRDNERLLNTLKHLRDLGNTVLVVEHDEDTILAADHVIDMGPGAGRLGGEVVAAGTAEDLKKIPASLTGQYLSRTKRVPIPSERREGTGKILELCGATGHNLQGVNLQLPLGTFICVTGVSGSGKSSLIIDTLYRSLSQALNNARERPLPFKRIKGLEYVDKIIDIDQSPIGRTPRSNPVTYTGIFDEIRSLFASLPESGVRGFEPGRFSFNVKGGRCEVCQGGGVIRIEMNFLPDVYVTCETCKGKRFNAETLTVNYRDKTIADVLDMTVDEALEFFSPIPSLARKLTTLKQVGLGYIHLGQQGTTLSGGEAQRVKLSKELSKRSTGKTLYILDEPTTGLHFEDTRRLIEVLHHLVDQGNTVLVIEHNLDVIKVADHIIDMGPEGGTGGGNIVVEGSPETVAKCSVSHTGRFLREVFARDKHVAKERVVEKKQTITSIDHIRGRRAKADRIKPRKY